MNRHEPIHVTVQGCPDDPRLASPPPGVTVHYTPPLHPDDLAVVNGIPCTSLARTLVDMAECTDIEELRDLFAQARRRGILDIEAVRASAAASSGAPPFRCSIRSSRSSPTRRMRGTQADEGTRTPDPFITS
jgi:hypothetical protein